MFFGGSYVNQVRGYLARFCIHQNSTGQCNIAMQAVAMDLNKLEMLQGQLIGQRNTLSLFQHECVPWHMSIVG